MNCVNEWYNESLINQRHLLAVLVSYLFIHDDRPKPAKVPAQNTHSAKYGLIIVFEKIPKNTEISCFVSIAHA